jgi:hypothetical protein
MAREEGNKGAGGGLLERSDAWQGFVSRVSLGTSELIGKYFGSGMGVVLFRWWVVFFFLGEICSYSF